MSPRLCATCGGPLAYSGRGRPPVVHAGSCARTRAGEVDERRRWDRYEEALRDAAVRAPLLDPAHVDSDEEDAGPETRLALAGFAPLRDDPREGVPRHERARTAHRDAVLASIAPTFAEERRKVTPAKRFARSHEVTDCYGCPLFDHLVVLAVVTPESLLRGHAEMRQDERLRALLADSPGALMTRRPA